MNIITSNSARGAYRGVVAALKKNLGDKNIVIAPDRFTASVERGLISSLNIESTFGIEVMSFTRLADRLVGKDIKKCLTPEGSVMLIGKVIADCRDELVYYKNVALADGFAGELYAALTAMRNSGIEPSKLRESLENIKSTGMRAKTQDIIKIYEGYLSALEGRHSDSSTRLYALAEHIRQNPSCVSGTHFYCTDIYEFSAPELDIISGLSKNVLSLTIGMPSGRGNSNRRIYPDRVIAKLKAAVEDNVRIEYSKEQLSPPVEAISTQLFSYSTPAFLPQNEGKVKLLRAKDRYDEVLALALYVLEHVRGGGRYKDIEVFTGDIADYESELKAVFARYNIPFFIDKKELLQEQTKVRFLLDAIACVRSGFKRREVLDFVKNPLFAHSLEGGEDDVFAFENYVLKYSIDRTRFLSEFTVKEERREDDERGDENVLPEKVRKALYDVLSVFPKERCPISAYVLAIRKMLQGVDEAWRAHVEKLTTLSGYYVKCAEQVDSKIDAVLGEIDGVLDMSADIEEFENILKGMFKTLKIALVPTYLDCVFVGDYDSRFMGAGDIYVIGATNDKLPRASGGGSVITPRDEEYFEKININITPNQRQKLMTDMYEICDILKKPHGKIVISYPENGGISRPSTIIFELAGMLREGEKPLEVERIDFDHLMALDESERMGKAALMFSSDKICYYEVLRNGISRRLSGDESVIYGSAYRSLDDKDKRNIDRTLSSPEKIDAPKGAYFEEATSVSRLETFFACPYMHYFRYILSLKHRKDGDAEGTEAGTILHSMLEQFFTDLKNGVITDKTKIAAKGQIYFERAIAQNSFEPLMLKPDTSRMLNKVKSEGISTCLELYDIYLRSEFKPAFLEAQIGRGQIKTLTLFVDGKKIALKGKIDRVDMLDDKFIIIDYKSFKGASLGLDDLYYGQKLQLYIYMRAIENSLNATPVGVFYLPVYRSFSTERSQKARYKLSGHVSDSREILGQIDSLALSDTPKQAIVPYRYSKKNGFDKSVHLDGDGFDLLGDYALALANDGASKISDGYIKPIPAKNKCDRCDYKDICAYRGEGERNMCKVDMQSFEMEEEKDV